MKIAYQGVKGAFSELAAKSTYPDYERQRYASFQDVFNAVENNQADLGIIPIENSYAGRVDQIHNILAKTKLNIIGEYILPIKHFLLGVEGAELQDITTAYSHPQALMQCSNNLSDLGITGEPSSNTAVAAKEVAKLKNKSIAAIGSALAAEEYGLKVLKQEMQDSLDNMTVFVIVSKQAFFPEENKGKVLTSMVYTIRNIPAALYKSLGGFATNNVNMIKLESYIPAGPNKKAQFFICFEGHPSQDNVKRAVEELGFYCSKTKILGVYYADPRRS